MGRPPIGIMGGTSFFDLDRFFQEGLAESRGASGKALASKKVESKP